MEKPDTGKENVFDRFLRFCQGIRETAMENEAERLRKEKKKTCVTFIQNECFEARILKDLQPEQRRYNLFILYLVGHPKI